MGNDTEDDAGDQLTHQCRLAEAFRQLATNAGDDEEHEQNIKKMHWFMTAL